MASKLGSLKAIIDSGRKAGIEAYHGSPYDFPAERELQFDDPRDVPIFPIRTFQFLMAGLINQLTRPFPKVPE
jgi:hypothetical protein